MGLSIKLCEPVGQSPKDLEKKHDKKTDPGDVPNS